MYNTLPPEGMTADGCVEAYADLLRDTAKFRQSLERVISLWPISCEQFLQNEGMNRIAWLGQASLCMSLKIPRVFRRGFMLLSDSEQDRANLTAKEYLARWIEKNGISPDCSGRLSGTGSRQRLKSYLRVWRRRGYSPQIPDDCPTTLMDECLAPSYRAIAISILKNDLGFHSLGFGVNKSRIYYQIKSNELNAGNPQMELFR